MLPPAPNTLALLMADFRKGHKAAANRLVELLYPELRKLAAAKMRGERREHTWQPTLLVNELYLALVKIKALGDAGDADQEKAAFLGLAGRIMKRLLIDHSRPLYRRAEKVQLLQMPDQFLPASKTYSSWIRCSRGWAQSTPSSVPWSRCGCSKGSTGTR